MVVAAFTAGLLAGSVSAPHCALMCGPLKAYACGPGADGRTGRALRYHLGRASAYLVAGAIAGALGAHTVAGLGLGGPWASALLSWTLAVALFAAALRVSPRRRPQAARPLVLRRRRGPRDRLRRLLPRGPLPIGLSTALLPCGALASAFALAAASGGALAGAAAMAGFAAASALGLVAVGALLARLGAGPRARWLLTIALVVGAVLLLVRPLPLLTAAPGERPACHGGAR